VAAHGHDHARRSPARARAEGRGLAPGRARRRAGTEGPRAAPWGLVVSEPATGRKLLGQILKARGAVREGQIQEALAEQRKHGGLIGQHLIALNHCKAADVAAALAEQAGLAAVDLARVRPSEEALGKVDASTAHAYCVLPLELVGGRLKVAIADPL